MKGIIFPILHPTEPTQNLYLYLQSGLCLCVKHAVLTFSSFTGSLSWTRWLICASRTELQQWGGPTLEGARQLRGTGRVRLSDHTSAESSPSRCVDAYQIFFSLSLFIFLSIFWVWGCAECVMLKIFINTTLNIFMCVSGWFRGKEHSVYCSRFFFFFPLSALATDAGIVPENTNGCTPVQLLVRHKYWFLYKTLERTFKTW